MSHGRVGDSALEAGAANEPNGLETQRFSGQMIGFSPVSITGEAWLA
jgi:hypothetical protein